MEVFIEIKKDGILHPESIWRPDFVVQHHRNTSYTFTKKEAEALANEFESRHGGEANVVSAVEYVKWLYEPDGYTVTAVEKRAKSPKRIPPTSLSAVGLLSATAEHSSRQRDLAV